MDLQVKQKKGDARKSIRKIARIRFDKKKYRKRKLGEKPFGNIEVRRIKCYYNLSFRVSRTTRIYMVKKRIQ